MHKHHYAPNRFGGKEYNYLKCLKCGSLSIHPIPVPEDLDEIYGESDHTYLNELPDGQGVQYPIEYPPYHYHKYQLDYFDRAKPLFKGTRLLDYACGSGFYLNHAAKHGITGVGVEFNEEFALTLSKATGHTILGQTSFEHTYENQRFDIIHFGHVLEHLPQPENALSWAKKYAHADTIILIDGPLEYNTCLTRWCVEMFSDFNTKTHNTHAPQHLTFTNHDSQLHFLQKCGLTTMNYMVEEQDFPFPGVLNLKTPGGIAQFMLSRTSILLSKYIRKWGNIFHFAGKFE